MYHDILQKKVYVNMLQIASTFQYCAAQKHVREMMSDMFRAACLVYSYMLRIT